MILHNERYLALSEKLGGMNSEALDSLFYWNNPFALKHWTLNVIELLLIAGAIAAFIHAWKWLKKNNDPTNLCICFAAIVYCLAIEGPIYFPNLFGLDRLYQVIFIHNEFSFGFLYNRTPLYILALYPALIYPSYLMIQSLGIFEQKNGILKGAICVGFVHHCFYEIFDHLGPQLGWWLWDYDLHISAVTLKSVPLFSLVNFALLGPFCFTYIARSIFSQNVEKDWNRKNIIKYTFLIGFLTPAAIGLTGLNLPYLIFSPNPNYVATETLLYIVVIVMGAITCKEILLAKEETIGIAQNNGFFSMYHKIYFSSYLIILALLWSFSFREYSAAINGSTTNGNPTGSLLYVIFCFVFAILFVNWHYFKSTASKN